MAKINTILFDFDGTIMDIANGGEKPHEKSIMCHSLLVYFCFPSSLQNQGACEYHYQLNAFFCS